MQLLITTLLSLAGTFPSLDTQASSIPAIANQEAGTAASTETIETFDGRRQVFYTQHAAVDYAQVLRSHGYHPCVSYDAHHGYYVVQW